ncbi:MAG: hypothetical protein ACRETL_03345 [Gammaproteobacteria bacterium]
MVGIRTLMAYGVGLGAVEKFDFAGGRKTQETLHLRTMDKARTAHI